jgi:glycosyltransferase involved in cell wall biosynthesis
MHLVFNILFINSSPYFGGTEKWAITCAVLLKQRGHEIWLAGRYPKILQRATDNGLKTIQLPLKNDFDLLSVFRLRKYIAKHKIDIIISTKVREYWLGGCAAELSSIPLIIRLGIRRKINQSFKNRLIYHTFMKAMIVNTEAIKNALLEYAFIDPERINVIRNGIDCSENLVQKNKNDQMVTIISIGALSERKNVRTIIQIFFKLQNQIDSIPLRLWIVGDGPQRIELYNFVIQLGIQKKVRFWGHRDDIPELLQQADIMLHLSRSEGFPNAAMEAMAAGVPLLISEFDGVEEFVSDGENAYVVNPSDEKNVIRLLMQLIKDPDTYNKIRMNAYHHMKTNFSLARMADETEHVIRSVING